MSLKVWLPLDGSLENKGESELTFTGTPTWDNNGKIGKCYKNGTQNIGTLNNSLTNLDELTFCAWVKTDENVVYSDWQHLLDIKINIIHKIDNRESIGNDLFKIAHFSIDGQVAMDYTYWDGQQAQHYQKNKNVINNWTHFTMIVNLKEDTVKFYINGNLENVYPNQWKQIKSISNIVLAAYGGYLNDVRLYDHALSDKEVKEVSKGLVAHYKLDGSSSDNIEKDMSGYGHDGVKTDITYSSDSPRYVGSSVFNGTSSFIACGRGGMVRDEITISMWAYMENWSEIQRLISCTEDGGWNIESTTNGMFQFTVSIGTSASHNYSHTPEISITTSGWHHIVCVCDGYKLQLYIDGELNTWSSNSASKTPIYYNPTNGIYIGAEAGRITTAPDGMYNKGNFSDVRIYATALSEEDIKELYETSMMIDDKGNLFAYDFIEGDEISIGQNGVVTAKTFVEEEQAEICSNNSIKANQFIRI